MMINLIKYIIILGALSCSFEAFSQDYALEVYMRKRPSKRYVIKIDDKVLVKCRHYVKTSPRKQLVEARLGVIDDEKFYFYPIKKDYGETIYTSSTLREIGIKTTSRKILSVAHSIRTLYDLIRFRKIGYLGESNDCFYKRVNVKSLKWRVRVIEI